MFLYTKSYLQVSIINFVRRNRYYQKRILWVVLTSINSISDNFQYIFVIIISKKLNPNSRIIRDQIFQWYLTLVEREKERQTTGAHLQERNLNENIKVRRSKKVTVVFSVVIVRRYLSTSLTAKYLNGHWTSFCKFSLRFYARVIIRKDVPCHVLGEKNYFGYSKESIV